MKQIVDKHTIIRLIKPEDNSVESIKKEINKNIDDLFNRVMGNPDNENFQISELHFLESHTQPLRAHSSKTI